MFTISSSVLVIDNPKLGLIFVAIVDELCLCNRIAISGSRIVSSNCGVGDLMGGMDMSMFNGLEAAV